MKKIALCAAALSMTIGSFAFADQNQMPSNPRPTKDLMRMDCRFYGEKREHDKDKRDCVASATYWVINKHQIKDIRYGVSCDRQTIYNDGGTYMPQEQVSDGIRPWTAAVPRVELMPQFALRNAGTYTSKLETDDQQLMNGVCYVNKLYEQGDDSSSDSSSGSGSDSSSGSDHGSNSHGNNSGSDHGHGNNSDHGSGPTGTIQH
ncbi:MAG: hypothetical protein ACJ763_13610 [Bdellovibrionia bacterium]